MTDDDTARLIYLVILGGAIAGYFLVANRHRMGTIARQAALWALIFIGVAAAAGLWEDMGSRTSSMQSVTGDGQQITATRAPNGHFNLTLQVNGTPVDFMVDTGASELVLSVEDAERVGIDHSNLRYMGRALTANGTVETAQVFLETVGLGGHTDRDVRAQVSAGEMPSSLLGMSYLDRFASIQIEGQEITLTR